MLSQAVLDSFPATAIGYANASADHVTVQTSNALSPGNPSDTELINTPVDIRVYP
jgi:hypothetical protein